MTMIENMSKRGARFPIQGNCWKTAHSCNISFCGLGGHHQSSGSIPWDLALSAYLEWQSKNGHRLPPVEDVLNQIAERGGFGHSFMDTYFGSRAWFDHFVERTVFDISRPSIVESSNKVSS
jgi:hypothetical protein